MAKMQKAIVYKGPGHFEYEDRPIPEIQNKLRFLIIFKLQAPSILLHQQRNSCRIQLCPFI